MLTRLSGAGLSLLLLVSVAAAQPPFFPGKPPQPGQLLPEFLQDQLKLTSEQKKQLQELQKEVDAKLAQLLTAEQKKTLQEMRDRGAAPGGGLGAFPPGGFGPFPPGGFNPFGGFGPTGRQDDVKKQLDARDEEWKVIGPKLQKVLAARQVLAVDTSSPGNPPPPSGPPIFGPTKANILTQAQGELRAVLDDPHHSTAEVQEKIAAVRQARQKARSELDAAQEDLRRLLTADQEAVLISLGYLD